MIASYQDGILSDSEGRLLKLVGKANAKTRVKCVSDMSLSGFQADVIGDDNLGVTVCFPNK